MLDPHSSLLHDICFESIIYVGKVFWTLTDLLSLQNDEHVEKHVRVPPGPNAHSSAAQVSEYHPINRADPGDS